MKNKKTKIIYTSQTELRRIIFTLEQITTYFYQNNNYLVLPFKTSHPNTVYLPDFEYQKFPKFLNQIEKLKNTYEASKWNINLESFDKTATTTLTQKFKEDHINLKTLEKKRSEWLISAKKVIDLISPLFQNFEYVVNIIPTQYGSVASQFSHKNQIYIYTRIDTDTSHLISQIITAYIELYKKENTFQTEQNWKNIEITIDTLMENSFLAELFPNYQPTTRIKIIDKKYIKLIKDNNKYLKKINYFGKNSINRLGDNIYINSKEISLSNVYPATVKVLKYLISHKNKLVTFDEIGDLLWKDDYEKFSMQAIAKQIQFIRNLLNKSGISKKTVKTYRKRGYMLEAN